MQTFLQSFNLNAQTFLVNTTVIGESHVIVVTEYNDTPVGCNLVIGTTL